MATPQSARLESLLGSEPRATGELIEAEVLQEFRRDRDLDQIVEHLKLRSAMH